MQKEYQPLLTNKSEVDSERQVSFKTCQFPIYLSRQAKAKPVYLTLSQQNNRITIGSKQCSQKQDINISVSDFIGFNLEEVSQEWIKIKLNSFVKKKKLFRSLKRYIQQYPLFINKEQLKNKNLQNLKINLLNAATNRHFKSFNQQQKLKLMIYFNPCAGANSKKHFDRTVDFIKYTNFGFDILRTEKRNHCIEHINDQLDFKKYQGIVIISGDGLMHEFVNSKVVGVLPVTHVPAGSGNAFAKYQMSLANQACQDEEAIFLAVKGKITKFNLVEFNLQKIPRPIYSFLSFQWCFIADIDMNSQFLRFLGGLRFQVYSVWRLISIRRYGGKLSYSLTTSNIPDLDKQIEDQQNFKTQDKLYLHQLITFIPWISDKYEVSPLLRLQDEAMDMQSIGEQAGRLALTKYMLSCESGGQFDKQNKTKKNGFNFNWLEPNGQDRGVFGIDGEQYQSQKIQAKISDKKVLTFC